VLRIF